MREESKIIERTSNRASINMDEYRKYEPIFGSWYLSKLIGKGSFGKVFEITREEFGTTYKSALKVITVPQNDEEIKARMSEGLDLETVSEYYKDILKEIVNENEIMAQLKGNSNIVSYEDHQIIPHEDGIGYDILIRMELLMPLLDRMIDRKLEEREVVKLGIDMCKALETCHKKNIIHRDIKPQNIFISDNGDYKLGDFGIARTMEKTTGGMSKKGTYKYMAPEVFKGENYDSTVDIYSLGIVLYSLLNGNRGPFLPAPPTKVTHNDEEKARMRRFRGEPLPAPAEAGPMLTYIIQKACANMPQDRYQSAAQMRRDLENYLNNYMNKEEQLLSEYAEEKTVLEPNDRNYTGSVPASQTKMETGQYSAQQFSQVQYGKGQYVQPQFREQNQWSYEQQSAQDLQRTSRKSIIPVIIVAVILVSVAAIATTVILEKHNSGSDNASVEEEAADNNAVDYNDDDTLDDQVNQNSAAEHVIAHRGTGGYFDNFESYDSAVEQGAKYIEQDVKLLDGDIFVAYEDNTSQNKIRLRDVFDRYGNSVTYVVEIKSRDIATEEAFIDLINEYNNQSNVIVQCFEGWLLEDIKYEFPGIKTMYLCNELHGGQAAFEEALYWDYVDIIAVSYDEGMMSNNNCLSAHNMGKLFSAWILNEESSIREAIDMGVDMYFTTNPKKAIDLEMKYR